MNEIIKSLSRDQTNDFPLLVRYSLVDNDVCNGNQDTIDHMTTSDEMKANVLKTLANSDTKLPKGSHDRIHPFGRVGYPVTYREIYEYLSCLEISPCNDWLSSNSTLRDLTTQRAVELSEAV
ncbi:unnamed protein product, partial [Didymodactylos carnosus]